MTDFQMRYESVKFAAQMVCSGKIAAIDLGRGMKEIYDFFKASSKTKSRRAKAKRRK